MSISSDFTWVEGSEPHRQRTREIIKKHPEVKKLIGKNPMTFLWILVCVGMQIGIAYFVKDLSWAWIIGVAWFVGAFPTHTLFVCIHESAHNLIFKKNSLNVAAGIIANFPSLFPTAISFKNYHLKHHAFQGVHELDADLPDYYEAKLINNYFIGKILWLMLYPFFQGIRTIRCIELAVLDRGVIMNILAQLTFDFLIVYFWGWPALAYLGLSFLFSVGLHPLGARWIQEHYLVLDKNQETYSYYGPLNGINMNVGYHNEHHDMPSVPWNNLPKLKSFAPEFYENLKYHTSFVKLLFTFIFSQEIGLYSRIARKERAGVPLTDKSTPDIDIA
ncbi:fatty acid desaturase [Aquirufa sp. 5-AUSEE-100C1]